MNKELIGRPLLAVIETSQDRIQLGQQPVMTILKPMHPIMAWVYKHLFKSKHLTATQLNELRQHSMAPEYVVEVDAAAFVTLTGQKVQSKYCRMVLAPSKTINARLAALSCNEDDARP